MAARGAWRRHGAGHVGRRIEAAGDEHTVGGLPPSMQLAVRPVAAGARADRQPEPGRGCSRTDRAAASQRARHPALPATVELFGVSTLSRAPARRARRPRRGARRARVAAPPLGGRLAAHATRSIAPSPTVRNRRGDDESLGRHAIRCCSSWGRQHAETAALVRGLPAPRSSMPSSTRPRRGPTGDVARPCPRRSPRRPSADPVRQTAVATRASRCTPAMARSASSRCCATPSATCSSPTRRCDPTTSSSSVPTSHRFEPFAAAVFGRGTLPVPVTVSDLSLGTENPVAAALAAILHTVAGRCTVERRARRRRARPGAPPPERSRPTISTGSPRGRSGSARGGDSTSTTAGTWLDADIDLGTWERSLRSLLARGGDAGPRTAGRASAASCRSTTSAATTSPASAGSPSSSPASATSGRLTIEQRTIGEWCDILVDTVDPVLRRTAGRRVADGRRARSDRRRPPLGGGSRAGRAAHCSPSTTYSPSSTASSPIAAAACNCAPGG